MKRDEFIITEFKREMVQLLTKNHFTTAIYDNVLQISNQNQNLTSKEENFGA